MKAIMLIADGLGDRPIDQLNNKTPLEYANTPTLDQLTRQGISGLIHPYRPGYRVGTDWGHLCLFGNDPSEFYTGRGSIEAISAGLELTPEDIAFRGNLATIDDNWQVLDRRAGRIHEKEEIEQLVEAINGTVIGDCLFLVKALTEHRVTIVMRGPNLNGMIPDTDPGTAKEGLQVNNPAQQCLKNAKYTAELLWQFLHLVHKTWNQHPINAKRISQGKPPANMILTRGSGAAMTPPKMQTRFPGLNAACIAGDITILGIAELCGMNGYRQPDFSGSFDTNYPGKAKLALELLNQGYNFVVVHIKATDLCGHDNKPQEKVKAFENIDNMFAFWLANSDQEKMYFAMTADHSTPCHLREHSADPVPSFIAGPHLRQDNVQQYSERACANGILNNYRGSEFTATLMDYLDCSKKLGA